jgi:site-specific recombinase XerC
VKVNRSCFISSEIAISHALHAGRSVVEVKEAAGHSSLATTSIYAHLVSSDDGKIGNLFD